MTSLTPEAFPFNAEAQASERAICTSIHASCGTNSLRSLSGSLPQFATKFPQYPVFLSSHYSQTDHSKCLSLSLQASGEMNADTVRPSFTVERNSYCVSYMTHCLFTPRQPIFHLTVGSRTEPNCIPWPRTLQRSVGLLSRSEWPVFYSI